MSLILAERIADAAAGASIAAACTGCAPIVDGSAAGWQMQFATAHWMSPQSMQQSGERALAAFAL